MKAFLKARLKSEVLDNLASMGITYPEHFENYFSGSLENINITHSHEVNQDLVSRMVQEIVDKLATSAALTGFPDVKGKTSVPIFNGEDKESKFDAYISDCIEKIITEMHEYVVIHQERDLDCFFSKYISMIKEVVSLHAPNSQIINIYENHDFFTNWYGKAKEYIQCLMVVNENEQRIKIEQLRRRRIKINKELEDIRPSRRSRLSNVKKNTKIRKNSKKGRHMSRVSYLQSQIEEVVQPEKRKKLEPVVNDNYSYNELEDAVFADFSDAMDSDDQDAHNSNHNSNNNTKPDSNLESNLDTNLKFNSDINLESNLDTNFKFNPDVNLESNLDTNFGSNLNTIHDANFDDLDLDMNPNIKLSTSIDLDFDSKMDNAMDEIEEVKEFDLTDRNFGFKPIS